VANGRVYETEYGWVAADDAGWTDEVYPTEAAARAAVVLTAAPKIRSEVIYTIDDDGIWVRCVVDDEPHWEVNLGFDPSVNTLMTWWAGHIVREHSDGSDRSSDG